MSIETTGYLLITGTISIFVAYYAMRFTAMRRYQREDAEKRAEQQRKRQTKLEAQ